MIKGGLLLGGGNASIALLGLLRNVLIARLISVEDFGIASTFAITMAVIEMTLNIAIDRLIVQAKDGDLPRFQATAHAFQAARGLLGAVLLYLVAEPISALFGVPHLTWAYQVMAVTPLLRGLAHFDMYRVQRDMRFSPSISVELSAQLLATLAAIPLAMRLGDYRAMLYALVLQQAAYAVASHVVAHRPYRWACDRAVIGCAVAFGWPLLLNGMLMFANFHGDRIIIGRMIGMTELGWYSAAFALTLTPAMVIARTMQSFFLPQLAGARDDEARFRRLYVVTVQAGLLIGVGIAVIFALAGPAVLVALYGPRYAAAVPLLVWLGVMQGLRIGRVGSTIVAMARADTRNPLFANLARVSVLPAAWIAASEGGGVATVVAIAMIGEGLAAAVSMLLLRRRFRLTFGGLALPAAASIAVLVLIALLPQLDIPAGALVPPREAWLAAGALPLLLWSMPALRRWGRLVLRGE